MNLKYKAVLAGIVVFGCGAGVGHILTKLHLEKLFEDQLAEEVENSKRYLVKYYKDEQYATPEGARKALEAERSEAEVLEDVPDEARTALIRYSGKTVPGIVDPDETRTRDVTTSDIYNEYHERRKREAEELAKQDETSPPLPKPVVRQNIFSPGHPSALTEPTFVPDEEARKEPEDTRDPYIMTFDEYNEDRHYTEEEVIFYTGDEVIADSNGEPIEEGRVDEIFGLENLKQFGDKFVMHICNPKLGLKYEVMRTDGTFAQLVAGLDPNEGDSG